jgi:hypothetical protein
VSSANSVPSLGVSMADANATRRTQPVYRFAGNTCLATA